MQQKLFLLSGVLFVALVAVAIVGLGGSTPGTDASAEKLAAFYEDNAIRQGIAAFLVAAAAPFVVFFGIGLATTSLSRESSGLTSWGYVLLTGTILVAGAALIVAFTHFALANGGDENISGTALQALNSLDGNNWMVFNPALGVMMIGAAGVVLSTSALRWLGWIALALGIALFIPFADFFALLGTLLWIVVAAILLARGAPRASLVATPEPAQ